MQPLTHVLTHTGLSASGQNRTQWIWMFDIPLKMGQKSLELQQISPFRAAHNPEVVGSSPASATKIAPGFFSKPGVFLQIWPF